MRNTKAIKTNFNTLIKKIYGLKHASRIEQMRQLSREEFYTYQNQELVKQWKYVIENTPYYKSRKEYESASLNLKSSLEENLAKLPILKKAEVKRFNQDFWSKGYHLLNTTHTTSGTSGTPLKIKGSINERSLTTQVLHNWYKDLTGKTNYKILTLSGFMVPEKDELFWVDPFTKNTYLSIYDLRSRNVNRIIDMLENTKPDIIYGYASAIGNLSDILSENDYKLKKEVIVINTSEVLDDNNRKKITKNLGNILNLYGSQEGAHLAVECFEGSLHVHPLIGIIELLDDNGLKVPEGELGRVIVTSLSKKTMPLLRYDIGDLAYASDIVCSCGSSWPTIGRVLGRQEDQVLRADGSKVPLLSFHALKNIASVKEGQLIQENFNSFKFNLVLVDGIDKDSIKKIEERIIKEIKTRLDINNINVHFNYVDEIPRGPNGKFKSVVVEKFYE
ncbi:phenylacetate--CoA ligase family protein [Bhargavaea ginsengi]|uniref:phenylacetate--CoA ligase family protein n=1 Tax=Bhargavaea ginsengi TaxID=426757 RepID=UPI003C727068